MRALVCAGLAPDFARVSVDERPPPTPGAGEVRVRIEAASLNFPDLLMLRGDYQHRPEPPFIVGMDFAGVIDAVGPGVERWRGGERVAGSAKTGAFAQFGLAAATALAAVPERMSTAEAAAYPAAYSTAHVGLVHRARLAAGETVLVLGASGGVGAAVIDVARVLGARTLAITSDAAKAAALRAYGADEAIVAAGGFRDAVKALTGGAGVEVAFDPVGGDALKEAVRCLAFDGRLVVAGFAGGEAAQLASNHVLIKGLSVLGLRAGEYARRSPDRGAQTQAAIWRWAADGATRPLIWRELPLADWRTAFEAMRDRRLTGKAVLLPWAE
jgi:NADPH2:quinone reductase